MTNSCDLPTRSLPRGRNCKRRGAVTVEMAVVLPVIVLCALAMIDVSQYLVAEQVVNRASIAGARKAADATTVDVSEVQAEVEAEIQVAYPNLLPDDVQQNLDVTVKDSTGQPITGAQLGDVSPGDSLSVSAQFKYSTVRWLKGFPGLDSRLIETTTTVRRE